MCKPQQKLLDNTKTRFMKDNRREHSIFQTSIAKEELFNITFRHIAPLWNSPNTAYVIC
jgi:hypothetical protein